MFELLDPRHGERKLFASGPNRWNWILLPLVRLQTEGEQIAAMRVVSWSRECREQTADEPPVVLPAEVRFLLQRRGDCEQFGDCDEVNSYSRRLEKKYARHASAMLALKKTMCDSLADLTDSWHGRGQRLDCASADE